MNTSILVIDSEPTVRTVVRNILGRAGFSVRATPDFGEALKMLHHAPADLVLTNVCLQGIAAHDAMLKLKQEFPDLPVLMVSGLPDQEVIRDWQTKDGFDVFPKPFRSDDLVQKVLEMLPERGW